MDYVELSKEVSYALRHAPWEYELELDSEGFAPVSQLLAALNEGGGYDRPVTLADLERVIATSEKKRHELQGDRIRALYGHTIPGRISKEPLVPPETLYHGTPRRTLDAILQGGLQPMKRQYVHLSVDVETALRVGRRRDAQPVILRIAARKASDAGVAFYRGNDKVVLADCVPVEFVEKNTL